MKKLFSLLFFMTCALAATNIQFIAHRGASNIEPENTLKAYELKADWIELDVHLSDDHIPIVVHDLEHAQLYPFTKKTNSIHAKKLSHILRGEKIPTLEEVLEKLPNAKFMIELKAGSACNKLIVQKTSKVLNKAQHSSYILGSKSQNILSLLKNVYSIDQLIGIVPINEKIQDYLDLKLKKLALDYSHVSPPIVEKLHQMGVQVWVWTVDEIALFKQMQSAGIDGVITNDLTTIKEFCIYK